MTEPKEQFEEKEWKCSACDYVYIGEEPPLQCLKCHAPKEAFIPMEEAEEVIEIKQ